jgi:hypothetical protein
MDQAHFPWRQLGAVLVEEGLVARRDLEEALEEQRQTGRLLGQILVQKGAVTGVRLARALAKQHGVELRQPDGAVVDQVVAAGAPEQGESVGRWDRPWKPLGKVLVENGVITQGALLDALVEKGRHPDRRLGEILVGHGHLTGAALASALAEQHGLKVEAGALEAETETVTVPVAPGKPSYHVCAVTHVLGGERRTLLYEGPNLLDAADFACDYIDREEPDAVEIDRYDPDGKETVWAYSRQRAVAEAEEQKALVDTFGFDPARWNGPSS